MSLENLELFEVFIRSARGLDHKHVGSLHAVAHEHALGLGGFSEFQTLGVP